LPEYLARKYELEAWVGDDFGMNSNEGGWARWGDPRALPEKHPDVRYVFKEFGSFSNEYPDEYFDRIFTVSTLEHIPLRYRIDVLKDMHRCLKPGGMELHTIDIPVRSAGITILKAIGDRCRVLRRLCRRSVSDINRWISLLRASGVQIGVKPPDSLDLLDRRVLVESPDVVYRFYPPNDAPSPYNPGASLLLVVEDK